MPTNNAGKHRHRDRCVPPLQLFGTYTTLAQSLTVVGILIDPGHSACADLLV